MLNRFTGYKRLIALAALSGGAAPVERTATGNPLTFETDLAKPLKSLIANFLPVQASGTPSPENILPITGWDAVNVQHFPQNLLSINRASSQTSSGITFTPVKDANNKTIAVHVKGKNTGTNTFFNLNYVNNTTISIQPGDYVIKGRTESVKFWALYIDGNGQDHQVISNPLQSTFTIPSDAVASWCRIQVENNADVDEIIYPVLIHQNDDYTLLHSSFPSTIYGGYVDMATGEVWGTYAEIDLYAYKGHFSYQSTYHVFYLDPQVARVKAKNNFLCLCNAYKYGGSYSRIADGEIGYIFQDHIAIRDDSFEGNASDFGNSLEGVVCVLELASPVLITTLTPQQINAIKNQTNTIWSDANGDCEVTYMVSAAYAEDHPVGGLGSGLLGFGSGNPDPDEPVEPDDDTGDDQPADDQPEEP